MSTGDLVARVSVLFFLISLKLFLKFLTIYFLIYKIMSPIPPSSPSASATDAGVVERSDAVTQLAVTTRTAITISVTEAKAKLAEAEAKLALLSAPLLAEIAEARRVLAEVSPTPFSRWAQEDALGRLGHF
ncbi:MAG: hypothetical protein V1908_00285 [Candidatus Peregrinibacteria bacterium]